MDAAKIFFSTAPIVFDITIVSLLVYFFIWVIRRLKLSSVLYGFLTLIAIFLISSVLHLKLTLLLFSYFTNVAVIVLCIIFQREIRKYLEVLSIKSLRTYRPIARTETFRAIEDSVHELAAQKTGALIVIKGSDPLNRFILNETELNGQLSYPLLMSIFDHHSPGHDGAVIIQDDLVEAYGVYLYLNYAYKSDIRKGTRHLAAYGLSQKCDAFIIVVSEERGTISIAKDGTMETVTFEKFCDRLEHFLTQTASPEHRLRRFILSEYRYVILALAITILLWYRNIAK